MKVSIIVPTYNNEKTINACLLSLQNQTYKNTEIIVIDDCSTDDTATQAQQFNVHYVLLKEKGYEYGARQMGLSLATGDVVLQTDADAVYPETFVADMLFYMQTGNYFGVEQGYILPTGNCSSIIYKFNYYKRMASFRLKKEKKKIPYGGTMYKKEAIQWASYKPLKQGTDTNFVEQLKQHGLTFGWCEYTFFSHHDPESFSQLFTRNKTYYKYAGKERAKIDKQYTFKRIIAILFPYVLFLAGERKTQYILALENGDIKGILAIFVGNIIVDLSSIGYFEAVE